MIKPTVKFLPANRQGIALDVLAAALNLFLFPFFNSRVGRLFDESFRNNETAFQTLSVLMFFIIIGRIGGLYLKRFPLQMRLEKSETTSFPLYFYILNLGVALLTAAFVTVLLLFLLGDLGIFETNLNGTPKDSPLVTAFAIFTMISVIGLEFYFLYRLTKPLGAEEKLQAARGAWKFTLKAELLADFGLFAYMMIWQVFYHQTAALFMTSASDAPKTLELKIFSLVFTFIVFLLFYLSPRAVFLIEDRKYLGTWLFILLVFLSSIVWYL